MLKLSSHGSRTFRPRELGHIVPILQTGKLTLRGGTTAVGRTARTWQSWTRCSGLTQVGRSPLVWCALWAFCPKSEPPPPPDAAPLCPGSCPGRGLARLKLLRLLVLCPGSCRAVAGTDWVQGPRCSCFHGAGARRQLPGS